MTVVLKLGLFAQNIALIISSSGLRELTSCLEVWLVLRDWVLGVSTSNREKVFCIDEDTAFLHDSERTLCTGLFNIPKELVLNTLFKV